MISYLLNALSTATSANSGTPRPDDELDRHGDVSPREVNEVEDETGHNDGDGITGGGGGPTPSKHDGGNSVTSREAMIMKYGEGFIKDDGKKKRKRGRAGARVSSSITTPAATSIGKSSALVSIPTCTCTCIQYHGCGLGEPTSILPKTMTLSTQLQIHAALMSTRSAIRRAYTHSHLGGIILISSSRATFNNNAGIVGGKANAKGGNDDIGGNCILAIRYCGFKYSRAVAIEIECARTSTLERAERFLGCCTGAVNNSGGGGDFGVSPPQWERYMLPPRVMSSYLGLLDNTCAYQGYSCMESGVKVYEGVLP